MLLEYAYNVGTLADILGAFEQAVLLAIFRAGKDAYGREILRISTDILGREVAAGAIYATLDRLEDKGLLSSRLEAGGAERGGRAKRYYALAAAGIKALNESKSAMEKMWRSARWPVKAQA